MSGRRPASRGARSLKALAVPVYAGMAAVALLWGWLGGLTRGWWTFTTPGEPLRAALLGLALAAGAVLLSMGMERTVPGVKALSDRFATLLAGATLGDAILLAGLSSVGEELLFRGCLQEAWGFWPATVLFAVVHSGPERVYLWWTASALVFGLGLGVLYENGGLLGPIAMHFGINVVNITLLGRKGDGLVKRRPGELGLADRLR